MKTLVDKGELRFVTLISLLVCLITLLPIVYAYITTPNGFHFMGLVKSVGDSNTYFDYLNQASQGHFFFRNSYTSENSNPFLIRPLFWLMGVFTTFLPSIAVWHAARVLVTFAFLFFSYYFVSLFTRNVLQRRLAFLIIAIGSGAGFFVKLFNQVIGTHYGSVDLRITEAIPFLTFNSAPHFTFSLLLIIGIMGFFYLGITQIRWKYMVYSGLLGFLLGFEHIYDMIPIYVVTGSYIAVLCFKEGKINAKYAKKLAVFYIISMPSFIYYFLVFTLDPIYKSWTAQNLLLSPKLSNYMFGFGFILFFAMIYIFLKLANKDLFSSKGDLFLIVWLVMNFLLLYLPVPIQRRFVEGLFIPIATLASFGFYKFFIYLGLRVKHLPILIALFLILILPTNANNYWAYFNLENNFQDTNSVSFYLPDSEYKALIWLRDNTNHDSIVLASPRLSSYIPRISLNKVYVGHWAQTVKYSEKLEWYQNFILNDTQDSNELKKLGIDYYITNYTIANMPVEYSNQELRIYKII